MIISINACNVRTAGFSAGIFAILTRSVHLAGYLLSSRASLYYWPVLACRKSEEAVSSILAAAGNPGPFVYASPIYRYFILPFYSIGIDRLGLFIFQSLAGALTAWLIFRISIRVGAHIAAALAVSICWSLYAPSVFYELTILPVAMLTLLITLFTLFQIRSDNAKVSGTVHSMLSGLMTGAAAGLRPPFILLFALPARLWIRNRSLKNMIAGALLLSIPLLFLSWQQKESGGGFYPFPRTAGLNLVLGHSSESTGYGPPIPSLGLVETGRADIHEVAIALAREHGCNTPQEADRYWTNIALGWMLDHPLEEIRLLTFKFGGFFGSRPFDTYYEMGRVTSFNPVLRYFFVPRWFLSVVFLLGLIPFCLRGKERVTILFPAVIALVSSLVFVHSERYFLPVLPVMLVVAASGIGILIRMIRENYLKGLVAGAAGLLLMIPSFITPMADVPENMYIGSLAVRAYHMEDYELSLELFEREAVLSPLGSVGWIQGHSESARISRALGYHERAGQHESILQEYGQPAQ